MNAYEIGAQHLALADKSTTYMAPRVACNPDACRLPISNHFPPLVRDALVRAASTPIELDDLARVKAIDHAVARARRAYPELFRPDA